METFDYLKLLLLADNFIQRQFVLDGTAADVQISAPTPSSVTDGTAVVTDEEQNSYCCNVPKQTNSFCQVPMPPTPFSQSQLEFNSLEIDSFETLENEGLVVTGFY